MTLEQAVKDARPTDEWSIVVTPEGKEVPFEHIISMTNGEALDWVDPEWEDDEVGREWKQERREPDTDEPTGEEVLMAALLELGEIAEAGLRGDFHYKGQHDQKSHAGGRGRAGMGDIGIDDKRAADLASGSAGPSLVQNADGTWGFSADRQALHDEIVANAVAGYEPAEVKDFYVLGGGPASGKSTLVESEAGAVMREGLVVSADPIKELLPEWDPSAGASNAGFVHEESSYLAARIQAAGFERGLDVTLDGMGDSEPERLIGKIEQARKAGYQIHGRYVTVDVETAIFRNNERAKKPPFRKVPEAALIEGHKMVSVAVNEAWDDFDDFELWDSSNGFNQVASATKGEDIVILDPDLWQGFIDKGKA